MGALIGWVAEQAPVPPLVATLGAFLAALALGDVYLSALSRPSGSGSGIYLSISELNLKVLAGLAILTGIAHYLVMFLPQSWDVVMTHRAVLFGALGGAIGTISGVWALGTLSRLMTEEHN
jgi:hypothetical protein